MTEISLSSPHVCARCAQQNPTCCSITPGEEEYCFPLTPMEMRAMAQVGYDPDVYCARSPNTKAFRAQILRLIPDLPAREIFPPGAEHWRLGTRDGRCSFLQNSGCCLPRAFRPRYCQLFPLWMHRKKLTCFLPENCLATQECATPQKLLIALGTTETEITALFTALCTSWKSL